MGKTYRHRPEDDGYYNTKRKTKKHNHSNGKKTHGMRAVNSVDDSKDSDLDYDYGIISDVDFRK